MALRWIGGVTVAILALLAAPPARADSDSCWQMINGALRLSARSPHAHFISYGERTTIFADGHTLERISSNITYRDDGIAYVSDERWVHPFLSARVEPGPPVLGPYGDMRTAWLSLGTEPPPLPVIADVHNPPRETCHDAGVQSIERIADEHLIVGAEHPNRVGLHEIWLDPTDLQIAKVVVRGPVLYYVENELKTDLTNFVVDIEHIGGYSVVQRVTWQYREHIYSQWTDLAAEYDFGNYSFSEAPPPESVPAWTSLK